MKKVKFYVCSDCGNILTATSDAEISCCGRKLSPLTPKEVDEIHTLKVEEVEDDLYVTFEHEMIKEHYICFVAYVLYSSIFLIKLYPEQNAEVRFPKMHGGKIYFYCSQHGLFLPNVSL